MTASAPTIGFGDPAAKLALFGGVALLALSLALSHGPGLSSAWSTRGSSNDQAWSPTSPSPPVQQMPQIQQAPQAPAQPVALPGRPGVAPAMDPLSGRPGVAPADAEPLRGSDGAPRVEGRPGIAPPDEAPTKNGRPGIPPAE